MRWRQAKKKFKSKAYLDEARQVRFPRWSESFKHRHWRKFERAHGPNMRATGKTYRMIERVVSAVIRGDRICVVGKTLRDANRLGREILRHLPEKYSRGLSVAGMLQWRGQICLSYPSRVLVGERFDCEFWDHHTLGL